MKYFSVFTGAGGFEQGMPSEWECIGFSEIDKYCNMVLRYHYPDVKNYGDICEIQWREIPKFDLLFGGSPCQDLSLAGKRKGLEGRRSGLFFEFARCLKEANPSYFIWENVKGALSSNEGRDFAEVCNSFSESGYDFQWQVLNAKYFGVPQNRERIFIIGHLRGTARPKIFPFKESGSLPKEEQGQENICPAITSRYHKRGKTDPYITSMINVHQWRTGEYGDGIKEEESFTLDNGPGRDYLIHTAYQGNTRKYEDYAPSLSTPSGGGHLPYVANCLDADGYLRSGARPRDENGKTMLLPIGYRRIRRLTPTECERLMSWQDGWTKYGLDEKGNKVEMSDTQRYKMCGNGVVSNVVRELVNVLLMTL